VLASQIPDLGHDLRPAGRVTRLTLFAACIVLALESEPVDPRL
jgi:hypothetical protein